MSNNQLKRSDTYELFVGTMDVINEALEEHSSTPVLREVITVADKAASGKRFGVAVYKQDSDEPYDYFTVRVNNKKVELEARGKKCPDIAWKVSQDYLAKVCENPQQYIDNPARLDLDWLKSRFAGRV